MPARKEMPSTLKRSPKKAQETWAKTHDSAVESYGEGEREITAESLEVAVLDRTRTRRKFKRLTDAAVRRLLDNGNASAAQAVADELGQPSQNQPAPGVDDTPGG